MKTLLLKVEKGFRIQVAEILIFMTHWWILIRIMK